MYFHAKNEVLLIFFSEQEKCKLRTELMTFVLKETHDVIEHFLRVVFFNPTFKWLFLTYPKVP